MNIGSINYDGNLKWLPESTILLARHGSHAYGLNTATSDLDVKGVAIPPKQYFLGMDRFEQAEFKDPEQNAEGVIYEIRKFCRLAADCNPNIIEVLWTDDSDMLVMRGAGRRLINNRSLFLSTKARHTFSGYAHSQLKRIKLHHDWHRIGESIKEPKRADYGLPDHTVIPQDQLAAAFAGIQHKVDQWNLKDLDFLDPDARIAVTNGVSALMREMRIGDEMWKSAAGLLGYDTNFLDLLAREKQYRAARADFDAWRRWKTERNPARAELEERYGYDTKHAMHLVRLLRMCAEILTMGHVFVKRQDREELLAIRNGAWSYEQLIEYAEKEDAAMEVLYRKSALPKRVDQDAINRLCIELAGESLR